MGAWREVRAHIEGDKVTEEGRGHGERWGAQRKMATCTHGHSGSSADIGSHLSIKSKLDVNLLPPTSVE